MWTQSIQGRCLDQVGLRLCCRVQIGFAVCTQWQQHKLPWSLVLECESIALQWQHCSSNIAMILWQHCISEILWQHCSTCDSIAYQLLLEKGMCNKWCWQQWQRWWGVGATTINMTYYVVFVWFCTFCFISCLFSLRSCEYVIHVGHSKIQCSIKPTLQLCFEFSGGQAAPQPKLNFIFPWIEKSFHSQLSLCCVPVSWLHCIMVAQSAK